ncbi:hypothetical protein P154DRAFT_28611 [Amniculicola lignicola CBS 123094]|uniref:Uncharacterized protein n=1 Tax=Amniculicola lignicola CBS 123094 TaxID=1392246 RepID=A0A6A5W046_9PLEO|nr:hypothetical protein P154DRAFT_28611 [Amniculicola lignicola CBS 123094]
MGKGRGDAKEDPHEHQSAPLSTLKDPSSFAPPPRHIAHHGAQAASPGSSAPSDSGGLGAPVPSTRQTLREKREAEARAEEEANRPPPGPYRADTTGLSSSNLPKPPVRRAGMEPPPPVTNSARRPPPILPPRLPPRQNSNPDAYTPAPPPPYSMTAQETAPAQGQLNQGALSRLAQAGVSVPGLDIGRTTSPPLPPRHTPSPAQTPTSPSTRPGNGSQLSELQSRFARMSAPSSDRQDSPTESTWAEKKAALRTASNLRNDPSKVSLSDARSAASTANNFRQRHGEQTAAGWQKVNSLNQQYGVTDRANSYASPASPPLAAQSPTQGGFGKKPPPPPPPKKRGLAGNATSPTEPPPIPLSSKPKF